MFLCLRRVCVNVYCVYSVLELLAVAAVLILLSVCPSMLTLMVAFQSKECGAF